MPVHRCLEWTFRTISYDHLAHGRSLSETRPLHSGASSRPLLATAGRRRVLGISPGSGYMARAVPRARQEAAISAPGGGARI
jgi:hypothetical protein